MRRIKAELIVILLLWFYAIKSLLSIQYIGTHFIIGLIGLAISTLLVARFYKIVFYLLSLLLLFSLFKLIAFSQTRHYVGVNGVGIDLVSTILLIYLCFKRRNVIRKWFAEDEESRKEKEESQKRKVLMFKKEFQNYSLNEIEKKLEANNLVIEARNALEEIMNERRNN